MAYNLSLLGKQGYMKISSCMNNGYLYMNYSHTNNYYLYVKLIFKKNQTRYQTIITVHAHSIHIRIEFTQWNMFNIWIATANSFREDW